MSVHDQVNRSVAGKVTDTAEKMEIVEERPATASDGLRAGPITTVKIRDGKIEQMDRKALEEVEEVVAHLQKVEKRPESIEEREESLDVKVEDNLKPCELLKEIADMKNQLKQVLTENSKLKELEASWQLWFKGGKSIVKIRKSLIDDSQTPAKVLKTGDEQDKTDRKSSLFSLPVAEPPKRRGRPPKAKLLEVEPVLDENAVLTPRPPPKRRGRPPKSQQKTAELGENDMEAEIKAPAKTKEPAKRKYGRKQKVEPEELHVVIFPRESKINETATGMIVQQDELMPAVEEESVKELETAMMSIENTEASEN